MDTVSDSTMSMKSKSKKSKKTTKDKDNDDDNKSIDDWKAYEKAIQIANISIKGAIKDVTSGSLFYHNHNVDPHWNDELRYYD